MSENWAIGSGGQQTIFKTAVPGLDSILGGGLPQGALVFVIGPPGSGKTTLATQMAFAAAQSGRRALLLTAFSEPSNKLIAHLRTYAFFDEALLGDMVHVLSVHPFLPQGLSESAAQIVSEARRIEADLVVLDGFRGFVAGKDIAESRMFLYEIGTSHGMIGATTIVTSEAAPRDSLHFPEETNADVLLGLHCALDGVREHHAIEVIKIRGSSRQSGLHGLTLDAQGLTIYPRLESCVLSGEALGDRPRYREPRERMPTNLVDLDELLGGGPQQGTSTLLMGSSGTGKTLLSLQWLYAGLQAGQKATFIGFREDAESLLSMMSPFKIGEAMQTQLELGENFAILRLPPVELNPDIVADQLLRLVDQVGAQRLVVDSIAELERALTRGNDPTRCEDFLAALMEALRSRSVTTVFTKETATLMSSAMDVASNSLAILAENVVIMQQVCVRDRLRRVISVPKMRSSAHDSSLHEFTISAPDGLRVLPNTLAEPGPETAERSSFDWRSAVTSGDDIHRENGEGYR